MNDSPILRPVPPKTIVEFDFGIGDRVVIRGSSIEADVIALMRSADANQYLISWWGNGTRFTSWVFAREIRIKLKEDTR